MRLTTSYNCLLTCGMPHDHHKNLSHCYLLLITKINDKSFKYNNINSKIKIYVPKNWSCHMVGEHLRLGNGIVHLLWTSFG
jgi:hypothetical protein